MGSALGLLGIAKKGGYLEIGEEPVGAAVRGKKAHLVLLAQDAAENSVRRATQFAQAGDIPCVRVPYSKAAMGEAVGRSACAMLAVCDTGLASAVLKVLASQDPEEYHDLAQQMGEKAAKVLQRQKERRRHEKNLREGKKKPWAAPARSKQKKIEQKKAIQPRQKLPKGVVKITRKQAP